MVLQEWAVSVPVIASSFRERYAVRPPLNGNCFPIGTIKVPSLSAHCIQNLWLMLKHVAEVTKVLHPMVFLLLISADSHNSS